MAKIVIGLFVPRTIRTLNSSYHGRFVPWTVRRGGATVSKVGGTISLAPLAKRLRLLGGYKNDYGNYRMIWSAILAISVLLVNFTSLKKKNNSEVTCTHQVAQYFFTELGFSYKNVYNVFLMLNMYSPSMKMAELNLSCSAEFHHKGCK